MKSLRYLIIFIAFILLLSLAGLIKAVSDNYQLQLETNITVVTDQEYYILRETVSIEGTVSSNGSPATDILVAVEILDPRSFKAAFRTATVGNPQEEWLLEVKEIYIETLTGEPVDTVKVGEYYMFGATIWNPQIHSISYIYVTITICDASGITISSEEIYRGSIESYSNVSAAKQVYVPLWAAPGAAKIYCNVYDKEPVDTGVPFLPETIGEYHLSRSEQGMFYGGIPLSNSTSYPAGVYGASMKLSPEPYPGTYQVYAVARYSPIDRALNTTTFEVLDTSSPPQAAFTYSPLNPYPNETVLFDASFSSAEGYDDVIIRYEWDFGDGSPPVVKEGNKTNPPDPTATHEYFSWETFIVTLNVTDTEGYWSTTQKTITVKPPYPVANFTWTPYTGLLNRTMIFDASNSISGWSISKAQEAPIVNYTWNFGDGNITTTTEPTISHIYTNPNNYTVTLTVTDSENQQDSISYIVEVINMTYPRWDINQDGKVDIYDVAYVAKRFGSREGDPDYDPIADMNEDGIIDIYDVATVAKHFGEVY